MSTLNPKTRRTVAAGLVVALGLMAPVGAAVADETVAPPPVLEPQAASHVYVDAAGTGAPDTYATIQEALQNVSEDGIIELASDVVMSQGLYVEKDVSLDLAGHSVVGPTNAAYSHAAIQVSEGHSLTIDGGGRVTGRHEHAIIAIGSVMLGDCTIDREAEGTYPSIMVTGTAGSAVIDGATVVNTDGPAVKLITDGSTLGVLDGYLEGSSEYGDVIAPEGASVSVSGGIFSQPVKANWCAPGYLPRMVTYDVEDDGYTVGAAIARPTAVRRTFDGTAQFGVEESEGYALSGSARDAGTHTTTVTLADGYAWEGLLEGESDALLVQLRGGDAESRENTAPVELTWTMDPRALDPSMATAPDQTFNGSAHTPLSLAIGDAVLVEGADYEVAYSDNVAAGQASWKATGKGNCTGTIEGTFQIAPADIADVTFDDIADQAFTGSAIEPALTATLDGYGLELGRDYTVSYKNNVQVGEATVVVSGIGSFTGTRELTFKIVASEAAPSAVRSSGTPKTADPTSTQGLAQLALAGISALGLGVRRRR